MTAPMALVVGVEEPGVVAIPPRFNTSGAASLCIAGTPCFFRKSVASRRKSVICSQLGDGCEMRIAGDDGRQPRPAHHVRPSDKHTHKPGCLAVADLQGDLAEPLIV
jgi:hypothetical protein